LKIVRQPLLYQRDAIEAAQEILSGRTITPADEEEVELFFRGIAAKKHYEEYAKRTIKQRIQEIIDPRLNRSTKIDARLWSRLLIVVTLIYYFIALPDNIRQVYYL